jgi:hypothetical protein
VRLTGDLVATTERPPKGVPRLDAGGGDGEGSRGGGALAGAGSRFGWRGSHKVRGDGDGKPGFHGDEHPNGGHTQAVEPDPGGGENRRPQGRIRRAPRRERRVTLRSSSVLYVTSRIPSEPMSLASTRPRIRPIRGRPILRHRAALSARPRRRRSSRREQPCARRPRARSPRQALRPPVPRPQTRRDRWRPT